MRKHNEVPDYTVDGRWGAVELRSYAPHLVAEVGAGGTPAAARQAGFRRLAGFIFGGNRAGTRLAMTTPVSQVPDPAGGWRIRFAMPGGQSAETLPAPNDAGIRFRTEAPGRVLALGFAGDPGDARIAAAEDELHAFASRQGFIPRGPASFHFYDSPFTPPDRRRNEVVLPIV